ncbi:flagellar motor protein MotB [Endozoicomonas sp. SM1973]|uniref:Flagellar motor protein MotB n=1 Tax=Spartinivicinus marinus TaxID=2994442 RepID=A0A853I273_9GAMM|nr:flagellar motor protein MotB [Spartinivicinus marinus]MCX4027593.1 flagellar motor protein MotB [Spartinivicinus marinus]NYZ66709.1 flagellar motor protein MotB [Spartinivicinus marinus]
MEREESIVIKRYKKGGHGHHGGSWKIAFADFATAMMAFFLVLWLISQSTEEQKVIIAGYFQDPTGQSDKASPYAIDLGGSPMVSNQSGIGSPKEHKKQQDKVDELTEVGAKTTLADQMEKQRLEALLTELKKKVKENPVLRKFKDQLIMDVTPNGLRIQIVDADKKPMFASGSAELKFYFEDILLELAPMIASVPNKISIGGHTDATPFGTRDDYGNWELSADRANTARRTLLFGGVKIKQVAQVVGLGDSVLFDAKKPKSPVNRRIDILILSKQAELNLSRVSGKSKAVEKDSANPQQPLLKRNQLNIFDAKDKAKLNQP